MQRIIAIICLFLWSASGVSALTLGQLMESYFGELLPENHVVYGTVEVDYDDVRRHSPLESALEKAVYHDMFPNASIALQASREATILDLTTLLGFHFGVKISGTQDALTTQRYDVLMDRVRRSYAYGLIQDQNHALGEFTNQSQYEITQVDNFELLDEVYKQLKQGQYDADSVSDRDLIYGAAQGLADSYGDPFTTFLDPSDVTLLSNDLAGNYAGIGAYVDLDNQGRVMITGTIHTSPSRDAGLQAGDQIIAVDGIPVGDDPDLVDVVSDIIGQEGSVVVLTIQRDNRTLAFRLVRAIIDVPFVEDALLDTGEYYIALYSVGTDADEEFADALVRFRDSGAQDLIIDLRDNPGGTLGETRVILDTLLPPNKRAITIKTKQETFYMYSYEDPIIDLQDYHIAVLINGGTASAAEIIAGTLEDYYPDTIELVGQATYGKGSVQQVISFPDGSGLKFTTAKWFTGKNKKGIDGVGISPDHEVGFREDLWNQGIDIQVESAKKILRSK